MKNKTAALAALILAATGVLIASSAMTSNADTPLLVRYGYAFELLPVDAGDPDCLDHLNLADTQLEDGTWTGIDPAILERFGVHNIYEDGGLGLRTGWQYILEPEHPLYAGYAAGESVPLRGCE